jgi:hypothetical protein
LIKTKEAQGAGVAPEVAEGQDPLNVRLLKYLVIVLGVLLIGCFVAVFAIIGYRLAHPRVKTGQAEIKEIALSIGAGAQLGQFVLDGDRMALHLTGKEGEEVVVVDVRRGLVLSRVRLGGPPLAAQP